MFFDDVRITLYFGTLALHIEITLQLRLVFLVIVTYFLLCHNYIILFFVVVTFYDYVRIKLYFSTLELSTEITL